MEEKNFHFDKINIIEVIKESLQLYKENYKLLLQISFFSFLINLFNTSSMYMRSSFGTSLMFISSSFIMLLISIPLIYLAAKLAVTLVISISKRYSNESISFKQAFRMSAKNIWTYIGISILYVLMFTPFVIIGIVFYLLMKAAVLKWIIILLLSVPTIYLAFTYCFASIATILEEKDTGYLKLSKKLVQGNLLRVILLLGVVGIVTSLPGFVISAFNPWFKSLGSLNQYILQVIHNFLFMFISPLISIIDVVLYLTLRRKTFIDNCALEAGAQNDNVLI